MDELLLEFDCEITVRVRDGEFIAYVWFLWHEDVELRAKRYQDLLDQFVDLCIAFKQEAAQDMLHDEG